MFSPTANKLKHKPALLLLLPHSQLTPETYLLRPGQTAVLRKMWDSASEIQMLSSYILNRPMHMLAHNAVKVWTGKRVCKVRVCSIPICCCSDADTRCLVRLVFAHSVSKLQFVALWKLLFTQPKILVLPGTRVLTEDFSTRLYRALF